MRTTTRLTILSLVLLTLPAPVRAEYTRIELKILGMDCAICAHGVRVAVLKVDGVDGVELSLERAQADIRLRADNRAALDDFRRIVKSNGFEPKEARVTAIGTVRTSQGKVVFEVAGVATPLVVSDKSVAAAHEQVKAASAGHVLEITGVVDKARDGTESIAVATAKRIR